MTLFTIYFDIQNCTNRKPRKFHDANIALGTIRRVDIRLLSLSSGLLRAPGEYPYKDTTHTQHNTRLVPIQRNYLEFLIATIYGVGS